jgi:hypothetical protein
MAEGGWLLWNTTRIHHKQSVSKRNTAQHDPWTYGASMFRYGPDSVDFDRIQADFLRPAARFFCDQTWHSSSAPTFLAIF